VPTAERKAAEIASGKVACDPVRLHAAAMCGAGGIQPDIDRFLHLP